MSTILVSVEGCKFVQLKRRELNPFLRVLQVSVEGCKFVQLKRSNARVLEG